MKQDTNIGTNILRVSASDEDADNNGAIRYSLTAPGDPSDLDYFDIQPESGWIFLTKPLDVSLFNIILHSPIIMLLINDILYFFIHLYIMVKEFLSTINKAEKRRRKHFFTRFLCYFMFFIHFFCPFLKNLISRDVFTKPGNYPLTSGPNKNQKQFSETEPFF